MQKQQNSLKASNSYFAVKYIKKSINSSYQLNKDSCLLLCKIISTSFTKSTLQHHSWCKPLKKLFHNHCILNVKLSRIFPRNCSDSKILLLCVNLQQLYFCIPTCKRASNLVKSVAYNTSQFKGPTKWNKIWSGERINIAHTSIKKIESILSHLP